jgi:hypothetical protein
MASLFIIEDDFHAEWLERFRSRAEAVAYLRELAEIPWDQEPNCAPCRGWRACHRDWVLIEYDESWEEIGRTAAFSVSADGVVWSDATL